jgi:hypothetical protein
MARVAKTTKTAKPAARGRTSARPVPVAAKTPAKVTKPAVAPKRAAVVAPKPSRPAAAAVSAKASAKVIKVAAAPKRAPVATAPAVKRSWSAPTRRCG